MRLGVLTGAPRVPGRARPGASGHGSGSAAPCQRARRTIASAPTKQGPQYLGRRVLCGGWDFRRPGYTDTDAESRDSGPVLNRALNKEMQQCDSLEELSHLLHNNDVQLDMINVSTAWYQLAKLRPFVRAPRGAPVAMSPDVAPLARWLMKKTIATVHLMDLRQLGNSLYSMGRLSVNLEAEPNGHYLAEQVEQRLLTLGEREGLASGRNVSQLWLSLSVPGLYPWDASMVARLVELSLQGMGDWDVPAVGQICGYWQRLGIQLAPAQKELFTRRVVSALEEMASGGERSDDAGRHVMVAWVPGVHHQGLELPMELLSFLHSCLLAMPPAVLFQQRTSLALYSVACSKLMQLGFQPTAEEAAAWEQRLMHPPPGRTLSLQELTGGLATLSRMSEYLPSSDVLARAAACVRDPRGCAATDAKCLLAAVQHWRLPCTQAQAVELRRLAASAGSEARTPGGGGTRPAPQ